MTTYLLYLRGDDERGTLTLIFLHFSFLLRGQQHLLTSESERPLFKFMMNQLL